MIAPQPDWVPHATSIAACVAAIIGILLTVTGFLLVLGLHEVLGSIKKLETIIERLFEKFEGIDKRLSFLEGECKVRASLKMSCARMEES
jgi:hypothetical protein